MIRLENWAIVPQNRSSRADDDIEYILTCIKGVAYNHPQLIDGNTIYTDALIAIDLENWTARTKNDVYLLGEPDEEWISEVHEQGYTLEHYRSIIARSSN